MYICLFVCHLLAYATVYLHQIMSLYKTVKFSHCLSTIVCVLLQKPTILMALLSRGKCQFVYSAQNTDIEAIPIIFNNMYLSKLSLANGKHHYTFSPKLP